MYGPGYCSNSLYLYLALVNKPLPNRPPDFDTIKQPGRQTIFAHFALAFAAFYWFFQPGIGPVVGALLLLTAVLKTRVNDRQEIVVNSHGIMMKMVLNKITIGRLNQCSIKR